MTAQAAAILAFIACFGSFTWSIQGGFFRVSDGKLPTAARITKALGVLFALVHLVALLGSPIVVGWHVAMALTLYGTSLGLFWRSIQVNKAEPLYVAFTNDQPRHLVTCGPYRYIRHPFYASYLLAWTAGIVASRQLWLTAPLLIMLAIYRAAGRDEERRFLSSHLSDQYQEYRRTTGAFIPRTRQHRGRRKAAPDNHQ